MAVRLISWPEPRRDLVDVELPVAAARVDEELPVRGPAVEVGRRLRRDPLRAFPRAGSVKIVDRPLSALWSLMPGIVPSKDNTWSLLFRIAKPVSITAGFRWPGRSGSAGPCLHPGRSC